MRRIAMLTVLLSLGTNLEAKNQSIIPDSTGLLNQTMLHPADAFTAYTFNKGEWAVNLPFALSPGWVWWGVTPWLTTELDLECWLGGVPSFNFRFRLADQIGIRPALAYETMFQYIFGQGFDLLDSYDTLNVWRRGASWYNHLNASWLLTDRFRIHLSAGATFSEYLRVENANRQGYSGAVYHNRLAPDISLGLDFRAARWLSLHSTASYGTTFTYLDNVPRKYQWTAGARIAPFPNHRWGILRTFRAELIALYFYFPQAGESVWGPMGYVFWQWGPQHTEH